MVGHLLEKYMGFLVVNLAQTGMDGRTVDGTTKALRGSDLTP